MTLAFSRTMRAAATRLAFFTALATGCAAVRNPALESARDAYQKARQDPFVTRRASVALDRAGQVLQEAERIWTQESDVVEVEHLAFIVEKRVAIARAIAERRAAAEEIRERRPPQSRQTSR